MKMIVIPVDGETTEHDVELFQRPTLDQLREVIDPHLAGQRLENVTVLYGGQRTDMFVGDESADGSFPPNPRATEIYWEGTRDAIRRGVISAAKQGSEDTWPKIYGPAVIFPSTRVWF